MLLSLCWCVLCFVCLLFDRLCVCVVVCVLLLCVVFLCVLMCVRLLDCCVVFMFVFSWCSCLYVLLFCFC